MNPNANRALNSIGEDITEYEKATRNAYRVMSSAAELLNPDSRSERIFQRFGMPDLYLLKEKVANSNGKGFGFARNKEGKIAVVLNAEEIKSEDGFLEESDRLVSETKDIKGLTDLFKIVTEDETFTRIENYLSRSR
ncbi:hypothetical protein HYV50_03430 [Candidatus Pacearchaeota archaeon]|nr:hypothetical protein [Candidatus Pacearchaeota archaeon]